MKRIDIFLGIKAEQTPRDAARKAEGRPDEAKAPELCPVGKKDWIAGRRIPSPLQFGKLEKEKLGVVAALIGLGSHQRIRGENVHLFAVRPPVPVFKDPLPEELLGQETALASPEAEAKDAESVICPVCRAEVNSYNIQYDPWGRMVGCYLCRGGKSDGNSGDS